MTQTNNTNNVQQTSSVDQQPMSGNESTLNKHIIQQSSANFTTDQSHPSFVKTAAISISNQSQQHVLKFSGSLDEDPGVWLDSLLVVIENTDMNPQQRRDFAAAQLVGKAQEWYRRHRLQISDIHAFINEFINTFLSTKRTVDIAEASPALTNEIITSDINTVITKFEQELRLKTSIRIIDDFPSFTGKPSQNIDKWLNDMHRMLIKMNISDDTKHQQIVKKLTGAAKEWYNNHQEECSNYISLKNELKTTFSSSIRDEMAFQRLPRQQNHNETIIDYYNHVLDLCKQADPNMSDESIVKYLKQGVKQSFREKIIEQDPTTPKEFLRVARRIEDIKASLTINTTSTLTSSNYASPSNGYHPSRPYNNNNYNYNNCGEYQQQHLLPLPTMQPTTSMLSQRDENMTLPKSVSSKAATTPFSVTRSLDGSDLVNNNINNPSPLPFIFIPVNNMYIKALVDTGATRTIIQQDALNRIRHKRVYPAQQCYHLADGASSLSIIGCVDLEIRIQHVRTYVTAAVAKSLSCPLILGQDWITYYHVDYNSSTNRLSVYNNIASVPIERVDETTFPVRLVQQIVLEPKSEHVVEAHVPISSSSAVLFHLNQKIHQIKSIIIPHSLLHVDKYITKLTIYNPNMYSCRLPANTNVGTITSLSSGDTISNVI
ncbi:unnamed protein product, partial [Rotaria sp. Silwood2]